MFILPQCWGIRLTTWSIPSVCSQQSDSRPSNSPWLQREEGIMWSHSLCSCVKLPSCPQAYFWKEPQLLNGTWAPLSFTVGAFMDVLFHQCTIPRQEKTSWSSSELQSELKLQFPCGSHTATETSSTSQLQHLSLFSHTHTHTFTVGSVLVGSWWGIGEEELFCFLPLHTVVSGLWCWEYKQFNVSMDV